MSDDHNAEEIPPVSDSPGAEVAEGQPEATEPTAAAGPTPGEAWYDVVDRMGELGKAISAWANAAANDPSARKHVEELRDGVNQMARQADQTLTTVVNSERGQQFVAGATQAGQAIGGAASDLGQAAAPHVATALAGIADAFGRAAQKVGEAAAPKASSEPPSRPAPEPPSAGAPAAPTPPASPSDDEPADDAVHE